MYPPTTIAVRYLRYLLQASNGKGHGIHSPFVFDFVTQVLNGKTTGSVAVSVEKLRARLLSDPTPVPVEDYGAGSFAAKAAASRSVASIARQSAKSARYAQLLFRIARHYHPQYLIELGTSLGISTAYLASADHTSAVTTAEGNHVVAGLARNHFRELGLGNISVVTGNFDNTLPQILSTLPHVDLAFIDGNHREKPTVNYFHLLLRKISPSAILIFDDIHWSGEMERAWETIRTHPSCLLTVDLFHMGIVFFRPEFKVQQHFTIRF